MQKALLIPDSELLIRLGVAAMLGSLIGIERERQAWAAGLRTHMLVSVGACLFMLVSAFGFGDVLTTPHVSLDPSRVAAQVVSGIGFIGGGCILLRGDIVRGLTTAASLWTVAAIGLAVGGGLYLAAGAATGIILSILVGLKPLEEWIQHRNRTHDVLVIAKARAVSFEKLSEELGYRGRRVTRFITRDGANAGEEEITITLARLPAGDLPNVLKAIQAMPDVRQASVVQKTG